MEEKVFFYREAFTALLPKRGSKNAAGFDLASAYEYNLLPGKTIAIDTGLKIILPQNTYGRVAGRSGLALKNLAVLGGSIFHFKNTFTSSLAHLV